MTLNEYQTLAARTIATDDCEKMKQHALFGLTAECAELLEACYQIDQDHIIKECGDVCWMAAELCTAHGWYLSDIVCLANWSVPTWVKAVAELIVISNGTLQSVYQKVLQGHAFNPEDVQNSINNIFSFIDKIAYHFNLNLEDVMTINIEKLKARYPDGFSADRSLHRADGDV